MRVPVKVAITRPDLGEAEADAAARVVRSGWVAQGAEVAAFESEVAAWTGATGAVAVANGTAALELALRAVGVGPGDDVLTVSHSFIASVNCIVAVGARPVLVDVESRTLGMDAARLEAAVTRRSRAILCVHQLGIPCDLTGILTVAARRGVPVIEDAACALGSEILIGGGWERIGRPRGVFACFSFHPRKIITTGEGGLITGNDRDLLARARSLRQHGMGTSVAANPEGTVLFPSYAEPGFNERMTDIAAAIGRAQLARLAASLDARRRIAAEYARALENHPVLIAPVEPNGTKCNWQSYPVTIRSDTWLGQTRLLQWFAERGIACQRGVGNAHQEPAYAGHRGFACGPDECEGAAEGCCARLAVSETLRDSTILLPIFQSMTEEERGLVIDAIAALRRL